MKLNIMAVALILLFSIWLSGCANECPLGVGDRVENRASGKTGTVADIGSGRSTRSCSIAVIHDDGTLSNSELTYGDGYYDTAPEYVKAWKYERID